MKALSGEPLSQRQTQKSNSCRSPLIERDEVVALLFTVNDIADLLRELVALKR